MKLAITLPDGVPVVTGKQVSFIAPCCSLDIDCLVVNGTEYAVVDADGINVAGSLDIWDSGAVVSVILDTSTMKAYVQNPAISPIRDRILHIEAMVTNNDFSAPICTDDGVSFVIVDDDGNVIVADWFFQTEPVEIPETPEQVVQTGIQMKLLWENASPTSEFAAQNISLDLSEYSNVLIAYRIQTSNCEEVNFMFTVFEDEEVRQAVYPAENRYYRNLFVTKTYIRFQDATKSSYNGSPSTSNSNMIPWKIYGIKGVTVA